MEQASTPKKLPFSIRLKGDKVLWRLVLVFALLSLVFVYSSSSRMAFLRHTTTFLLMLKQMRFIILGLVAIYICHLIPLGWYRKLAYIAFFLCMGLLYLTLFMGETRNEGTRWLNIMGVSFQTSEFAKVALVLFIAKVLEDNSFISFKEFVLKFFLPVLVYILPIILEGFSSGSMLVITVFLMLLISQVPIKHVLLTAGICVVMVGLLFGANELTKALFKDKNNEPYTIGRVETVLTRIKSFTQDDPNKEENEQVVNSKIAIASGGVIGKFPGNGTQRYVLPLSHSDYIYSIIVEETGLVGAVVVILLYLWILYRVVLIARSCSRTFSSMLVSGLGILILLQAMIHILVNVGLFPVTGQNLPLISLGGSSFLAMSISFGLMLSVSRTLENDTLYKLEEPYESETH